MACYVVGMTDEEREAFQELAEEVTSLQQQLEAMTEAYHAAANKKSRGSKGLNSRNAAAIHIGISHQTLHNLVHKGQVPAEFMVVLPGGRRFFRDLDGLKTWYWRDSFRERAELRAQARANGQRVPDTMEDGA